MKFTKHAIRFCIATVVLTVAWQNSPSIASAQMEIRKDELYHLQQFIKASPTVGESAPELDLVMLSGERVKLSDYRNKQVVLIKAGYT